MLVPIRVGLGSGRRGPSLLGTSGGHATSGSVPVALSSSPRLWCELGQCEPDMTWSTTSTDCRVAIPPDSMLGMLGGDDLTTGSVTVAYAGTSGVTLCMQATFLLITCLQSGTRWVARRLPLLGLWVTTLGP